MRLSSSESRVASVSRGGSTERALTRDDVSFDVSRVRAPPSRVRSRRPARVPVQKAPSRQFSFAPTPHHPRQEYVSCAVNSRCPTWRYIPGRFIVGTTGSAPSAAVLAASTAFARPATPMPHHHTRPAVISAATPWRGTGNISTSRPHPARARPRSRRSRVPIAKPSDPNPRAPILRPQSRRFSRSILSSR